MLSEEKFFHQFLKLTGKKVKIGAIREGELLEGTVINTMFDSVLLSTTNGNKVVAFSNIGFYEED